MTLYNLRSPDTVTKFDAMGNVEAVYSTTYHECSCPAGSRSTCRHRQMLLALQPIADSMWFLDWDNGAAVVDFSGTPKSQYDDLLPERELVPADPVPEGLHVVSYIELPTDANVAEEFEKLLRPAAPSLPAIPSRPWRRI